MTQIFQEEANSLITFLKIVCKGKIYNVKKASWHALSMSKDAKVLIVENDDTTRENSEYYYFR